MIVLAGPSVDAESGIVDPGFGDLDVGLLLNGLDGVDSPVVVTSL